MKINGIEHPNAIMRVVHVTQKHIDNGIKCNCMHCPLTMAISEVTTVAYYVGITNYWPANHAKEEFTWLLPTKALQFRRAYDQGHEVSPFSFEIPVLTQL